MATSIGVVPRAASATSETRARFSANLPIVCDVRREKPPRVSGSAARPGPRRRSPRRRGCFRPPIGRRRSDRRQRPPASRRRRRATTAAELRGVRARCASVARIRARRVNTGHSLTWTTTRTTTRKTWTSRLSTRPTCEAGAFCFAWSPSRWRRGATRWRRSAGAGARPRRPRRPPPPSRSSRRRCSGSASRFSCPRSPAAFSPGRFARRARSSPSARRDRRRTRLRREKPRRPPPAASRSCPRGAWRRSSSRARRTQPPTRSWRARFCSWPSGSRTTWGSCARDETTPGCAPARNSPRNAPSPAPSSASSPRCRTRASRR